jgi:thiamine-phosphate pyrophosphorylase
MDGVHLDDPNRAVAARTLLGGEGLIGVSCALSRHAAMVAGEAGADYVMFGSLADLPEADGELADMVAWWSEMFVLPCVAAGRLNVALCRALVRAGADMLAVRLGEAGAADLASALCSPGEYL